MRWLPIPILFVSTATATAEPKHEDSIYEAELSLGYGLAVGGGGGTTSMRPTPLEISIGGSVAISDEPHLAAYGGALLETLDRNAVGARAGVQLARGPIRLSAGGVWIIAPDSLYGAQGGLGACHKLGVELCAGLEITAYFAGGDLAEGRTVTHVSGVLGVVFDAL